MMAVRHSVCVCVCVGGITTAGGMVMVIVMVFRCEGAKRLAVGSAVGFGVPLVIDPG